MNASVRYTAEEFAVELPAAEYAARFRDAERIAAYCRRCPNYGRSWGCPPFAKDPAEEWLRYGTALLVAAKITPCEEGLPPRRGREAAPPRAHPDRKEAPRAGAPLRRTGILLRRKLPLLPRRKLHPAGRAPLPPSRPGEAVARSVRIRHRPHDLRTVRHRTEMGRGGKAARIPDARMRSFPRRRACRVEGVTATYI